MENTQQPVDPLLEPKEVHTGEFFVIPTGYQVFTVTDWEVDMNYTAKSTGQPGWNFTFHFTAPEFTHKFDDPEKNTFRLYQNTCSEFGKQLIFNLLQGLGCPSVVPDPNDLTTEGKPRRSFFPVLFQQDPVTKELLPQKQHLVGKRIFIRVTHNKKCGHCSRYVADANTCSNCQGDISEKNAFAMLDVKELAPWQAGMEKSSAEVSQETPAPPQQPVPAPVGINAPNTQTPPPAQPQAPVTSDAPPVTPQATTPTVPPVTPPETPAAQQTEEDDLPF